MKKQEIISVLYELYKITGFRMSLHDVDFNEIAAYPPEKLPICACVHRSSDEFKKCIDCDASAFKSVKDSKEPLIYKCRYGLTEAISPLYNFGILTGYLMMGQIADDKVEKSSLKSKLQIIGVTDKEADALVDNMRVVPEELVRSYTRIMTICAQYLTLSNAMPGAKPTVAEAAKKYILENLDKKITIKDICETVGCSKTTLISAFKREFGTTVNSAITEAKIEEAKNLLSLGKMSISEIAQATGFYDQAYFSKVFSAECGISPSEYRRSKE